jgi:Na+-driven multidrug efflux pump
MSNFLIYIGVYGTAIVFNSTLETLVPHAVATNKHEIAGHLLNRAMFLWLFFFGLLFAGIFWIDEILIQGLEWDEDEARATREYMVFASPALFLWGVLDAQRRFVNSFQKFWTPAISMSICVAAHPFVCHYFLNEEKWGMKGLAMAQLVTNFASYFFMRALASCDKTMGKAVFFPRCKTCANLC